MSTFWLWEGFSREIEKIYTPNLVLDRGFNVKIHEKGVYFLTLDEGFHVKMRIFGKFREILRFSLEVT